MPATFLLWGAMCILSLVGTIWVAATKWNRDCMAELTYSFLATLPGIAVFSEAVVRLLARRAGSGVAFVPYAFITLWPATLGMVVGLLCLVVSISVYVPKQRRLVCECIRAMHVITWILSGYAILWAFVSV